MNKKTRRKIILSILMLAIISGIILLATVLIPFFKRETNRSISMYVNPDFKLSSYNNFYIKHDYSSYSNSDYALIYIRDVLTDCGLEWISSKSEITKKTLYIQLKGTEGLVLPPHIGHFNPQFFIIKTITIELSNALSEKLLLKIYTWRGVFNYGYDFYEQRDFLKKGLIQAGWKEKKAVPVSEVKQSGN